MGLLAVVVAYCAVAAVGSASALEHEENVPVSKGIHIMFW